MANIRFYPDGLGRRIFCDPFAGPDDCNGQQIAIAPKLEHMRPQLEKLAAEIIPMVDTYLSLSHEEKCKQRGTLDQKIDKLTALRWK